MQPSLKVQDKDEPPPFLGTWPRVYAAIVFYLVFLIVLFYTFSVVFTPAATQ